MKLRFIQIFVFCTLIASAQKSVGSQNRKIRINTNPDLNFSDWIANIPSDRNLKGKYIVLEFWATNCEPCLKNVKHLNDLQSKFKNPNLYFISLTSEEPNVVLGTLKKVNFKSIVVSDRRKHNSFWNGGVQNLVLPFTVLIDNKGIIKWIGAPSVLTEKIITDLIENRLEPYSMYGLKN